VEPVFADPKSANPSDNWPGRQSNKKMKGERTMTRMMTCLAVLAFVSTPAFAEDTQTSEAQAADQQQTAATETEEQKDGIVKKAVKLKAVDAVGNDGIIEKGAKVKILTD
jgi:hypothetical protein